MCLYAIFYISYFLMLVFNALLVSKAIVYAGRKNRSAQKPIITTLLISGLFILGWTVYMFWISVMVVLRSRVERGLPPDPLYNTLLVWLEFLGYFLYTLSTWGNPLIYTSVNKRFAVLVSTRRTRLLGSIQNTPTVRRIRFSVAEARKSLTTNLVVRELSTKGSSNALTNISEAGDGIDETII